MKYLIITWALAIGLMVPLQAIINARLSSLVGGSTQAALISFSGGFLIFVLIDSKKIDLLNKKVIENFSSPVKEVLLKIKDNPKISQQALQKELRDSPKVPDFLNYIFLKSDLEKEEEKEEDIAIEFEVCLDQTEKIQLKESLNKLSSQIKEFENKGDSGKVKKLIQEFNNLSKKLS